MVAINLTVVSRVYDGHGDRVLRRSLGALGARGRARLLLLPSNEEKVVDFDHSRQVEGHCKGARRATGAKGDIHAVFAPGESSPVLIVSLKLVNF